MQQSAIRSLCCATRHSSCIVRVLPLLLFYKYNNITIAIVCCIRVASRWFKYVVLVYIWYFLSPILKLKYTTINHGGQSKHNNKHHNKSNSGTIFVLIGDRRLVNKATKVLLNHTTRVTTFNGWFFELPLHTTNIVGRMSLERRITQTT